MPELHHLFNPAINAFSQWKDPFYSVPFPSSPVVFTQCTTHWRNHWSRIVFVSVWFSVCHLCLQWAALDRFLCFIWKTATKFQRTWVKCCHRCHLTSVLGKVTLLPCVPETWLCLGLRIRWWSWFTLWVDWPLWAFSLKAVTVSSSASSWTSMRR